MEEITFRSMQKIENMQVQFAIAADHGKAAFLQYLQQFKQAFSQLITNLKLTKVQVSFKEIWFRFLVAIKEGKDFLVLHFTPINFYRSVKDIILNKWTRHNLYCGCIGLVIGTLIGYSIGVSMQKQSQVRYIQAIQCIQYGSESASIVEDALAPYKCGNNEVLIEVKAASVQVLDAQICSGYGRRFRSILRRYLEGATGDLPVTLGRDCSGVIIDIGQNVKRLDVGDEVWVVSPFWATGTLSQIVHASETKVGRKPKNTGFEGACSLPYAGSTALNTLQKASLNSANATSKRIFIQGGCTPVGCILIQLLHHWNAHVTTTCFKRAVPVAQALGADDIICFSDNDDGDPNSEEFSEIDTSKFLTKHLRDKEKFDVIINTRECGLAVQDFLPYCNEKGRVVSALPPALPSDHYGFFRGLLFWTYLRTRLLLQNLTGARLPTFGEPHTCNKLLDKLTALTEEGLLQSVVDKVFHPTDIHLALNHIQSSNSIGSTVITFR